MCVRRNRKHANKAIQLEGSENEKPCRKRRGRRLLGVPHRSIYRNNRKKRQGLLANNSIRFHFLSHVVRSQVLLTSDDSYAASPSHNSCNLSNFSCVGIVTTVRLILRIFSSLTSWNRTLMPTQMIENHGNRSLSLFTREFRTQDHLHKEALSLNGFSASSYPCKIMLRTPST